MSEADFYTLTPAKTERAEGGFATAAILDCGLCGQVIDGMGGGACAVCKRCGDELQSGRLRGAVVWEPTS